MTISMKEVDKSGLDLRSQIDEGYSGSGIITNEPFTKRSTKKRERSNWARDWARGVSVIGTVEGLDTVFANKETFVPTSTVIYSAGIGNQESITAQRLVANKSTFATKEKEVEFQGLAEQVSSLKNKNYELRAENRAIKQLLYEKYSTKKIFMISSILTLAMIYSLVGWLQLDVKLIHPVISTMGLIGSFGFLLMSLWRMKY